MTQTPSKPALRARDATPAEQIRTTVLMLCRGLLSFIGWANRYYELGLNLRERAD